MNLAKNNSRFLNNKPCYLSELTSESKIDDGTMLTPLRNLLGRIPDSLFTVCSRSIQLSEWYKNNRVLWCLWFKSVRIIQKGRVLYL